MTSGESGSPPTPPKGTDNEVRVRLIQTRPFKGRVEENLGRIRDGIDSAGREVDLLVFPECATSGYFVEAATPRVALTAGEVAQALGSPTQPTDRAPDVVLGFYERDGDRVFNSVAWFTPGPDGYRLLHCHRKVFLPTYGVFDESRFVSAGREFEPFDTRFGRVGLLVCEELLHGVSSTILALGGAELIITVAASPAREFAPGPGRPQSVERWDVMGRAVSMEHGVNLAICHLVGSEGGKIFSGGSAFYLAGGNVGPRAPLFREGEVQSVIDRSRVHRERLKTPLLSDLREWMPRLPQPAEAILAPERVSKTTPAPTGSPGTGALPDPEDGSPLELDLPLLEEALLGFLRDEIVHRRGFSDVVVGVSGGVDSAVSLLLAARALGPDHVHALLLPYATSSPESLEHGHRMSDVAGVKGRTVDITRGVDAYIDVEEPELSGLRRGNLAARFRAMVLWDQAARHGALPLGTGNKSERLLGYFTWHADDAPPINPLGDLFKTQVWALARHLGVPDEIVEKAPSADLVPGVHDEDELGVGYEVADRILHWLLEGYVPGDLVRAGFPEVAVERVWERLEGTHWKRSLPTTAMVSSSAIGEFYLRPVDY